MKRQDLLVAIFAAAVMFTSCEGSKTLNLTQKGNGSSGSYWEYELSSNDILKETDYTETSFFGPGYTQHWTFEIIGEGEVTIRWLAYEGDVYQEKDSYSVTYSFDHNGNGTIISNE